MSYFCISWFSLFKYRDASLQLPGLLQPFVLLHLFPLQIWLLLLYGQLGLLLLSLKLSGRFISYNCLFYVSLFFFLSFFFGHTHYCCKKIFIWASEVSRLEKKGRFRMKMCVSVSSHFHYFTGGYLCCNKTWKRTPVYCCLPGWEIQS